jgi:hypothetical protein
MKTRLAEGTLFLEARNAAEAYPSMVAVQLDLA